MDIAKRKRSGKMNQRKAEKWFVALVIIPAMLYFTLFYFYPTIMNIYYMFCKYNLIKEPEFIGLKNILKLFSDETAWVSLKNTLLITVVCTPVVIILSLLIARCLFNLKRGAGFFRSLIFAGYLTSMAVVALVFKNWFGNELGFVNGILSQIGLEKIEWLTKPHTALIVIMIASVWKFIGYFVVIFLAGFANVNADLYEAARIDGARSIQLFFYVTIPQLMPTIVFSSIIAAINYLRSYSLVVALTGGDPYGSTKTFLMYIFEKGFVSRDVGYSSVLSMVLLVIILVITLIQMKLTNSFSGESEV